MTSVDNFVSARYSGRPMSRKMQKIFLIFTVLLGCSSMMLSAQSNNSAGDLFLRGYNLKTEAEKLEQSGDTSGALAKFQQAQQAIAAIAQNFPDWQPEVVNYRLRLIEQSIAKLSGASAAPSPATTGGATIPAPAAGDATPAPMAPSGAGSGNPLEMINQMYQQQQQQIGDLQQKLRVYEDGYTNAVRDRNRALQDVDLLRKQQEELTAKADALAKELSGKDEATQKEIERIRNEAQMVKDMLTTRSQQLVDSGKAIEALEKEKGDLLKRNKELEKEIEVAKKSGGGSSDAVKKLMAENSRLKEELEGARKQVDALREEGSKKDAEIASLRTQITGIQTELTKLRQENTAYQGQVADLTVQLKEVNAKLAKSPASKDSPEQGKLNEENEALRAIIMRQLRQQARQLEAKEIVIAEMKDMEGASQRLIENLEDMTAGKIRITVEEESLFTEPELKEILASSGGVYATLEATSNETAAAEQQAAAQQQASAMNGAPAEAAAPQIPTAELDENALMGQATDALRRSDYRAAELAYQDALRANPKNIAALTNLAGIKLHSRQFDEAEVLLQKCLVYEPNNDTALYRLGICYFQQSKLGEAKMNFEKSLSFKKDNARAHHYLGIITTRQGNRDRAETEFKSALAIDPEYGDAHFNLAVLYATSTPPNWELARKHYKSAMDRGIKSDPAMERLLNDTSVLSSTPVKTPPATASTIN